MAKRKSTKKSSQKIWSLEEFSKKYFILIFAFTIGLTGYYFLNSNFGSTSVLGDTTTSVICTRKTPYLSVEPVVRSAGRGGEVKYSIFIKNNDPKECINRAFILSKELPTTAWIGTFDKSTLTINSGSSYTQTFKVKSASSSKNGSYRIKVKIKGTGIEKSTRYVVITPTPSQASSKSWFIF